MLNDVLGSRGLSFSKRKVKIKNSTGGTVTKGDLLQFDIQSGSRNFKEGDENSAWFNCRVPQASASGWGFYVVAIKDMAVDEVDDAWIQHPDLKIRTTGAVSTRAGSPASGATALATSGTAPIGAKALALPLETSGGAGLSRFLFDGFFGLGTINI